MIGSLTIVVHNLHRCSTTGIQISYRSISCSTSYHRCNEHHPLGIDRGILTTLVICNILGGPSCGPRCRLQQCPDNHPICRPHDSIASNAEPCSRWMRCLARGTRSPHRVHTWSRYRTSSMMCNLVTHVCTG